jgi:hypothetical protein
MKQELQVMRERNVWELVPKPTNVKILGNRWVYTVKNDADNNIVKFKARLVAQGFNQRQGESYEEVFSPVVNFAVIRLFFSLLVSLYNWLHYQIDIKCAYLYAHLDDKIFMRQPQGFIDPDRSDHVCLLKRAIYGLHQSGREWYFEIQSTLESLNFQKLDWVNCVYTYENNVILLLYVDDIILFGRTKEYIDCVIEKLKRKFEIKVLGKTKKLLGVEFEEMQGKLYIHQTSYIDKVCKNYERYHYPVTSLPIAKGIVLSKMQAPSTKPEITEMSNLPYRNLLGCLAFLASRTRPDISYAVNVLSQFQSNPGIYHWNILLKLLGYVSHTRNFKLDLSQIKNFNLSCYSDADFATNRDDRISMGGMILFIDEAPILWKTFKQKCISLSTMESEYVSLTEAAKELIWVIRIMDECIKSNVIESIPYNKILYCDNLAAIDFSNSPIENSRTKHIDVKYNFLRDLIYKKLFKLKYVSSKRNFADIFTKAMPKIGLKHFVNKVFAEN